MRLPSFLDRAHRPACQGAASFVGHRAKVALKLAMYMQDRSSLLVQDRMPAGRHLGIGPGK